MSYWFDPSAKKRALDADPNLILKAISGDAVARRTADLMGEAVPVADVVPLTGENRVIVKYGLDGLGAVRNAGLRALLDVAGFTGNTVPTARQVAYQMAPRLNAAGRMDTAMAVIELFRTDDPARARALAQQLDPSAAPLIVKAQAVVTAAAGVATAVGLK